MLFFLREQSFKCIESFYSCKQNLILYFNFFSDILPGPQIMLPRSVGEQVNTSLLDLRNYSTTNIDVPSADITLVLKVQ